MVQANSSEFKQDSKQTDPASAIDELASRPPHYINPQHYDEWLRESCVSRSITEANIESISSPNLIASWLNLKNWNQDFGGWRVRGVNPTTNERVKDFGQFKPDKSKGKNGHELPKYMSPKGGGNDAIFLYDPDKPDFWQQEVSEVIITEGAKKAGAAITYGFHAVCLTGVNNGVINKERLVPKLRDYIRSQPQGLKVNLCFDADLWSNRQVGRALLSLGDLLELNDCEVEVTDLSPFGSKKGIDDVIATRGIDAFREALNNRYPFSTYYELVEKLPLSAIQEGFQHLYERDKWIEYDDQLCWWNGQYFEPQSEKREFSRIGNWCRNFRDSIFQDYFQDKEGLYDTPHSKPSMPGHIYAEAKQELYVDPERVNPPNVLNLKNGVLELVWDENEYDFTEKFYPHEPGNYWKFTYVTDVAYDPEADPTYCDQLLKAIPEQYRDIMLKNMAAGLNLEEVRNRVSDDARSIILWGGGSNGKDSLRTALSNIFSERYLTSLTLSNFHSADKSGRGFTLVGLHNSKINWSSENKSQLPIDQMDTLKNALSGDPVTVERKNVDHERMRCNCIFIFNTNHEPNIKGYDQATRRRLTVVRMPYTFVKNPKAPDELQANPNFINTKWLAKHVSPALLNVLLYKLHDFMRNGIDYSPTAPLMESVAEESDHFLRFAHEVGLQKDPEGKVPKAFLWRKLREWYLEHGYVQNDQGVITHTNAHIDRYINFSQYDRLITEKPALRNRMRKTFHTEEDKRRVDGKPVRCFIGVSMPEIEAE